MTLGEGMAPFLVVAESKLTAQPKEHITTNINTKVAKLNRRIGLPLNVLYL